MGADRDRILAFGFATDGPIATWQAGYLAALSAVDGVRVARWFSAGQEVPWQGGVPAPETTTGDAPKRLDILLDFTRAGLSAPLELAPEAWHFSYGPGDLRDPARAAVLDYVRTPGHSNVALISEPGSRILREGTLFWSRGDQLNRILLDPAEWPAIVARDRLERTGQATSGAVPPDISPDRQVSIPRRDRLAEVPGPIMTGATIGRRIAGAARFATRHDDWNIGVIGTPIRQFLTITEAPDVVWLGRRSGHFAADPFGVEREGVLHLFFEDYDQKTGRGSIAYRSIDASGTATEAETVLDPGVHASYPYIVERDGTTFMLPETSAAGELVLYESTDFPRSWRRAASLLPIPVADATVVEFDGRWWMFGTRTDRGPNNNLFIWHAPDLMGPWRPHEGNPVKTDARSARPGGTPFVVDGRLYRPSQDSSRIYGGGLVINRVEVLTPRTFAERAVRTFVPEPGSRQPHGWHTLSTVGNKTLIDGNRRHFVPETLRLTVSRRLNSAIKGR